MTRIENITRFTILPEGLDSKAIIGVCDFGFGYYFGGVTACAAYIKPENMPRLLKMGVTNPKAISDERILALAPLLNNYMEYSLEYISPTNYNNQLRKRSNTELTADMYARSIAKLQNEILDKKDIVEGLVLRQFESPQEYFDHMGDLGHTVSTDNVWFSRDAENTHLAVAVAYILARYEYLTEMSRLTKLAGIELPIGRVKNKYIHNTALDILKLDTDVELRFFAKLEFAVTDSIFDSYDAHLIMLKNPPKKKVTGKVGVKPSMYIPKAMTPIELNIGDIIAEVTGSKKKGNKKKNKTQEKNKNKTQEKNKNKTQVKNKNKKYGKNKDKKYEKNKNKGIRYGNNSPEKNKPKGTKQENVRAHYKYTHTPVHLSRKQIEKAKKNNVSAEELAERKKLDSVLAKQKAKQVAAVKKREASSRLYAKAMAKMEAEREGLL